ADRVNRSRLHAIKRNRIDCLLNDRNRRPKHCLGCTSNCKQSLARSVGCFVLSAKTEKTRDQNGERRFYIVPNGGQGPLPHFFSQNPNNCCDHNSRSANEIGNLAARIAGSSPPRSPMDSAYTKP